MEFRPEYRGAIPDHISVELEFMQRLTEIEAEARRQDREVMARWLQLEQELPTSISQSGYLASVMK